MPRIVRDDAGTVPSDLPPATPGVAAGRQHAQPGDGDAEDAALVSRAPTTPAAVAVLMTAGASSRARGVVRAARAAALAEALLCLAAVALIWVGAAALVQSIYSGGGGTGAIRAQPLFLTWLNNSEFLILLPLQAARERWGLSPRSDWRGAARAGLLVCPLWFLAQGSYNWSLSGTSVSSSTVLSSSSCVFTFALSVAFLGEAFRWPKLAGVLVTVAGAACVAAADHSAGGGASLWGDALALFSAAMFAAYSTAIRALLPDGSPVSMWAFFGFLGAFNSLLCAPVVAGLIVAGAEAPAALPPAALGLLLLKGLLDNVLSDVLWARAIQLTSPTLATVALTMTIPVAMLSDVLLHAALPAPLALVGGAVVMCGFVLTTVSVDGSQPGAAAAVAAEAAAEAADAAAAAAAAAADVDAADAAASARIFGDGLDDDDDDGGRRGGGGTSVGGGKGAGEVSDEAGVAAVAAALAPTTSTPPPLPPPPP